MSSHLLSPDTQAILLLCGQLGQTRDGPVKPLTLGEYDAVAQWLIQHDMRPADLIDVDGEHALEDIDAARRKALSATRLRALLDRGAALALAVEGWVNRGLWVIGRPDADYPQRFRARLGRLAPPVLYGAGRVELLAQGGLAVLGARDADQDALEFTRGVARTVAGNGTPVVSGGARGVDREAMAAALSTGGASVAVLADSLARSAVSGAFRQPLLDGALALVSPYDPGAGFSVGNAMGRNKHIYALADRALIVDAGYQKGGTWAGAIEALKTGQTPVFVRMDGSPADGNRKLVEEGAFPFPAAAWAGPEEIFSLAETETGPPVSAGRPGRNPVAQTSLFPDEEPGP